MKRNLFLIFAIVIAIILIVNSTKRILTFRTTSQQVAELEARLEKLKQENQSLKHELEYKKSEQFAEEEIRNKLGLSKAGETVFVLPKDQDQKQLTSPDARSQKPIPNWQKWWNLFFGG